jgi:hypothetical protein
MLKQNERLTNEELNKLETQEKTERLCGNKIKCLEICIKIVKITIIIMIAFCISKQYIRIK